MDEVSYHELQDLSMKPDLPPKPLPKVDVTFSGEDVLRIMKLAKSAGVKQFSCNGLVFSFT